jgi:hypothetical protein
MSIYQPTSAVIEPMMTRSNSRVLSHRGDVLHTSRTRPEAAAFVFITWKGGSFFFCTARCSYIYINVSISGDIYVLGCVARCPLSVRVVITLIKSCLAKYYRYMVTMDPVLISQQHNHSQSNSVCILGSLLGISFLKWSRLHLIHQQCLFRLRLRTCDNNLARDFFRSLWQPQW